MSFGLGGKWRFFHFRTQDDHVITERMERIAFRPVSQINFPKDIFFMTAWIQGFFLTIKFKIGYQ